MKLFKIENQFYYYHRTEGWIYYCQGMWRHSLIDCVYDLDDNFIKTLKSATPEQFERKHKKNLRRSIKTFAQKYHRALKRLQKLMRG